MKEIKVALVGQPNVGKSTLFNILTQGNVIVSNWPGTTVEKHVGIVEYRGFRLQITDLPGIYGLTYSTLEEKITRDFLLREKPDVIVVLADSLALERTMYLAIELLELSSRVVVALTKSDATHSRGIHINHNSLERALGVPVVPVSAAKKHGLTTLLDKVIEVYSAGRTEVIRVDYGELEYFIDELVSMLQDTRLPVDLPPRWIAIKFLEKDREIRDLIRSLDEGKYREMIELEAEARRRLGEDLQVFLSKKRFEYIERIAKSAVSRAKIASRHSERLSRVFYNPILAPIFSLLLVLGVFIVVFAVNTGYPFTAILDYLGLVELSRSLGEYSLNSVLEKLFDALSSSLYSILGESILVKFLVEGVINGLFALMAFIPLLLVVFIALGALEDSGLAPRLAIGLHTMLQRIGLSGHSVFPLTLSMGCNVPGIMATRASPNVSERIKLLILAPFIPCQARLVVLIAFATSMSGLAGALLIPLAYLVSFIVIAALSYIMSLREKRTGRTLELLLELPPIHRPIPRVVWWFTWFHLKHFLVKAGTIIVLANIAAWLFTHMSPSLSYTEDPSGSIAFEFSRLLSPVLKPLGIEEPASWNLMFSLVMGFVAKEVFLTSLMATTGQPTPFEAIRSLSLTPASAIAIALFITLYVPCIATLATIYSETRSIRVVIKVTSSMMILSYTVSILSYHLVNTILG